MGRDMNSGSYDDKYLYETLARYGRLIGGIDAREKSDVAEPIIILDIRINAPMQMQILSGDDRGSGGYQTVSKMKVQPSSLFFQRSQLHSSF